MIERLNEPYAQEEWGNRVAMDFFLGGSGAGLIAFYVMNLYAFGENYRLGIYLALLSLALVCGGLALLASELGRPSNLWRSATRFRRSWMARGSVFNLALLAALLLLAATLATRPSPAVAYPFYLAAGFLGLLVAVYPGMLLHSVRDIKSWRSNLQPALTFVEATLGGLGLLALAAAISQTPPWVVSAEALALSALALLLSVAFLLSLGRSRYAGARATYSGLVRADGWQSFYLFAVLGIALPSGCFLAAVLFPGWTLVRPAVALGALSLLAGNLVYRLLLLRTARHEPLTILNRQR
jgi:formate-dependent nitrite reductase membrane component NrfD